MSGPIHALQTEGDLDLLVEQLDGREPVFVIERWLDRGTLAWDVRTLPHVFVAADVGEAFVRRGVCILGTPNDEKPPR